MSVDGLTVRKAVHDFIQNNPQATYDQVVESVCGEVGAAEKRVCDELQKMEENGFLYCIESGETTEVKVA